MNKEFLAPGIGSIIYALLLIPSLFLSIFMGILLASGHHMADIVIVANSIVNILIGFFLALLASGFVILAKKHNETWLGYLGYATIGYSIFSGFADAILRIIAIPESMQTIILLICMFLIYVVGGILFVLLGIFILRLHKKVPLNTAIGICFIISGICSALILLFMFSVFFNTAIGILCAVLFFRLWKQPEIRTIV
jgi:hypothetical protein